MKTNVCILLAAGLLSAACSNDNEPASNEVAAVFTTNMDKRVETRMADGAWAENDAIGIFSLTDEWAGAQGTTPNMAVNTKYTRTSLDTWSSDNAFRFKNPVSTNVEFKAYYPHTEDAKITEGNAGLIDGTIAVDVSDQTKEGQAKFDFLFANKDADDSNSAGSKANPNVKFQFTHSMAKVIIILTPDETKGVTFADVQAMTPTLQGLMKTGTFSLTDGTVTATATTADITLLNSTEDNSAKTKTFIALVPPQTAPAKAQLSIAQASAGTYLSTQLLNGQELAAGKSYQYTISVKKLELQIISSDITNWEVGLADGTGDAVLQ